MSEEKKQETNEQEQAGKRQRFHKQDRVRLFPIWLRLVIVVALIAVSTIAGAVIGYGVIGDGNPLDALKWSTWQHIVDIVGKDTSN